MKPLSSCGGACSAPVHVDWANIGDGPAGRIAEIAIASDVADYVRFRAVCRPWRRCSPDPRAGAGLDGRFLPWRWIMLGKASSSTRRHRFLNVYTGECIRMDIPELADYRLLALTPEGLLLLLQEPALAVHLLNPLTGKLTSFPPLTNLLTPDKQRFRHSDDDTFREVIGVGLVVDRSMLVVRFNDPSARVLAVAEHGGESWIVVDDGYIGSTVSFAGRFYCTNHSGVMVLDTTGADQQPPRLRVVVEWSRQFYINTVLDRLHLVDNDGDLMLVQRMSYLNLIDNSFKRMYKSYRVDQNAGILIPTKSLNGRAVFMGMCLAISISPKTFPSVTPDTLYFGVDCEEKWVMDGYCLADGSNVPCYDNRSIAHPLYSRGLPLFLCSEPQQ